MFFQKESDFSNGEQGNYKFNSTELTLIWTQRIGSEEDVYGYSIEENDLTLVDKYGGIMGIFSKLNN